MVDKTSRILGIIALILGFMFLVGNAKAQQIVRKGNTFVEQKSDTTSRGGATKTQYVYTDSKGQNDTIYVSSNGNAFIWKVSKKTGKMYRKYLPEVTKQLKAMKK